MTQTVGFQGERGAFSEEAARALFGETAVRGFRTFDLVIEAVRKGEVDVGLLPCENTIAGSVARAYDLLYAHPELSIVDETTHRIEQTLIGTPDACVDDVRAVASHPVALDQCRRFFAAHPSIEAVVVDDTAGAVREIIERGDPARAAIGPALAAQRYGGTILARTVADDDENFTRFFVVSLDRRARRAAGRATVSFVLPHAPGSLHRALGIIAERAMNLRSLVARPRPRRPFEYVFHADIDASSQEEAAALAACLGSQARVLGWY